MTDVAPIIFALIETEFGLPAGTISAETTADDVDGWDSLRHATLLILIERRFRMVFRGREVANLANVGDLVNLVESKLA